MVMAQPVSLLNKRTAEIRKSATGFSWTMLLFGFFPPLFRSDWKGFIIVLLINLIGLWIWDYSSFITAIIFGVTYNKTHLNDLINSGFVPQGDKAFVDSVYLYAGITPPIEEQE